VDNEVLYCGYRFDPETGLYCVRHRYYHPTLGRFIQRDPGADAGQPLRTGNADGNGEQLRPVGAYVDGMNVYQYVQSSPPLQSDPKGLWGRETHYGKSGLVQGTYDIAVKVGFSRRCAEVLANWDEGVDDVTPAYLYPYYHFEPGRKSIADRRWQKGIYKLRHANVYLSPWIWDVSVYDGLAHIGEALHGYQDSFAHISTHQADTPLKHVTGPNSGHYSAGLAARTRFHKEGDSLNYRPDDPDLWPVDHAKTVANTEAKLEEVWRIPAVQCHCKK